MSEVSPGHFVDAQWTYQKDEGYPLRFSSTAKHLGTPRKMFENILQQEAKIYISY